MSIKTDKIQVGNFEWFYRHNAHQDSDATPRRRQAQGNAHQDSDRQ